MCSGVTAPAPPMKIQWKSSEDVPRNPRCSTGWKVFKIPEAELDLMGIGSEMKSNLSLLMVLPPQHATNREKELLNSTRFGMIARWKSLEGVLQCARRQATLGKSCPKCTQEINTNHPKFLAALVTVDQKHSIVETSQKHITDTQPIDPSHIE